MDTNEKIKMLRRGIMCAVVHLFKTHPDDVLEMFSLEELEKIALETTGLENNKLEGIYKDALDMSE